MTASMFGKMKIAAVSLFVLAGASAAVVLHSTPAFYKKIDRFDGHCEAISLEAKTGPGLIGVEDIVIDHALGVAYLSATDRRDEAHGRGAIYMLPLSVLSTPETAVPLIDLTQGTPADFHPHGIDLHIDEDGIRRLFVVSHDKGRRLDGGAHIHIYRLGETGFLELEESVSDDELLYHPNDVTPLSPTAFFATQDLAAPSESAQEMVDIALHRRTGHLVLVAKDEQTGKFNISKVNVGPFAMSNGVSFDAASRTLYVVETLGKAVNAYRVTDSGGLIPLDRVKTPSFSDNLAFDEHGRALLAGHVSMTAFMQHMNDANKTAPSDVIRFDRPEDGNVLAAPAEDILITTGQPAFGAEAGLSGISIAAAHGNMLLLGSVFEPRIWRCKMD